MRWSSTKILRSQNKYRGFVEDFKRKKMMNLVFFYDSSWWPKNKREGDDWGV